MNGVRACLSIVLLWAIIYLPGLGTQEVRGEEWRRVQPGRTMIETGEWVVPQIGGKAYSRKPPLINWISAGSMQLFGVQNEWTSRLPSVLTVLFSGLLMMGLVSKVLGMQVAWLGAMFYLSMAGVIEKGRLAELEVYYIAFTGMAFFAWLAVQQKRLSAWLGWSITGISLGLGMLTKGPVHLLFFYGLVIGVHVTQKRWREFFSVKHLWCLVLCFGLFALWAIPFAKGFAEMIGGDANEVVQRWNRELSSRATGQERSSLSDWLTRGPEAFALMLPWSFLLALSFRRGAMQYLPESQRSLFKGALWGLTASFALMVLLPSSSPRYIAPLFAPAAFMAAWWVCAAWASLPQLGTTWLKTLRWASVLLGFAAIGVAMVAFSLLPVHVIASVIWAGLLYYMVRFITKQKLHWCTLAMASALLMGLAYQLATWLDHQRGQVVKPLAQQVIADLGETSGKLIAYRMGANPYLFYLPEAEEVASRKNLEGVPMDFMLVEEEDWVKDRERIERDRGKAHEVASYEATWGEKQRGKKLLLLQFSKPI